MLNKSLILFCGMIMFSISSYAESAVNACFDFSNVVSPSKVPMIIDAERDGVTVLPYSSDPASLSSILSNELYKINGLNGQYYAKYENDLPYIAYAPVSVRLSQTVDSEIAIVFSRNKFFDRTSGMSGNPAAGALYWAVLDAIQRNTVSIAGQYSSIETFPDNIPGAFRVTQHVVRLQDGDWLLTVTRQEIRWNSDRGLPRNYYGWNLERRPKGSSPYFRAP